MKIIDANIVLRYLLKDDNNLFLKSIDLIENNEIFLPNEIVAEIVYVLEKVYDVPKNKIYDVITDLFTNQNFHFNNRRIILESLKHYSNFNLDYADALLAAYHTAGIAPVITFDKKLKRVLNKLVSK